MSDGWCEKCWKRASQRDAEGRYTTIPKLFADIDRLEREKCELINDVEALTEKVQIYERQTMREKLEYSAKLERENLQLREKLDVAAEALEFYAKAYFDHEETKEAIVASKFGQTRISHPITYGYVARNAISKIRDKK